MAFDVSDQVQFRSSGWTVKKDFLPQEAISALSDAVCELGKEASDLLLDRTTACTASDLIVVAERDDPLRVCRYEHILAVRQSLAVRLLQIVQGPLEELCGFPLVPFKDKVNNKQPGGGAYRPHQDFVAYKAFPPRYHATAMLSVDACTIENGCLWVADNYQQVARCHPHTVVEWVDTRPVFQNLDGGRFHGDIEPETARRFSWKPVPTKQSDLLVLDSFVPHRSDGNRTHASRRALFLTFSRASDGAWYEQYYEEKARNPLDPKFHVSTPTHHSDAGTS